LETGLPVLVSRRS